MGFLNNIVRKLVSYFSVSLGLFLILTSLFFAYENLKDLTSQNEWVTNTINVINQTSKFQLVAKDIQSNMRGYLVTENQVILSDIKDSKAQLVGISDTLFILLKDDQAQRKRVIRMLSTASEIIKFSQAAIDSFRVYGRESASSMIRSGKGIFLFDKLNNTVREIDRYAGIELDNRRQLAVETQRMTKLYIIFTGIGGFAVTVLAFYFLLRDRRKQRELKKELITKERLLNQYLEAMPDGVLVVDPNFDVTFINASGKNMLGLEKAGEVRTLTELTNKILLYDPSKGSQTLPSEHLPIRKGLLGTKSSGNRIDLIKHDRVVNLETNVEPILDLEGGIIGALSVFRDVTDREAYAQNLTSARDIAEQSVKVRDAFLSNVSHEIRTPLNAILGFTNWLQQEVQEGTVREYVGYIHMASTNLLELINDLLDISKIEVNQIVFDKGPTSIMDLINSVGILIKQRASEKGIVYRQKLADDLPKIIITDKLRLTQILLNLCGNAIKFTEEGYVELEVKLLSPVKNGTQRIQFVITDTGIGIPEDKKEQIFDRFVQATKNTTSKFGGTGLGLPITKALVRLLEGDLVLESTLGKGTTFTLEFDFEIKEDHVSPEYQESSVSIPEYMANLKIIAAEDNVLNQKLLKAIFGRVGVEITMVNNGLEAIQALEAETFDVIIMDVQMPVMDGYTAIRKIRNTLHLTTPIITMTAHAMVGEKEEGARIGANSYISKPFKEYDLFNEIIKLTKKTGYLPAVESKVVAPPLEQPASTLVDAKYLHDITGGDESLRQDLVMLFEEEVGKQYAVIYDTLKEQDYDGLRKAIHALRSSLISVALLSSSIKFKEIEARLSLKDIPADLETVLVELDQELKSGMEELKSIV